jgi:hypothetical protein
MSKLVTNIIVEIVLVDITLFPFIVFIKCCITPRGLMQRTRSLYSKYNKIRQRCITADVTRCGDTESRADLFVIHPAKIESRLGASKRGDQNGCDSIQQYQVTVWRFAMRWI